MKKHLSRILAVLLALSLVFGGTKVSALAEEIPAETPEDAAEGETEETPVQEIRFVEDINAIYQLHEFTFMLSDRWALSEELPEKDTFVTADGQQRILLYAMPYEDLLAYIDNEYISEEEAAELAEAEAEALEDAETAEAAEEEDEEAEDEEETEEAEEEAEEPALTRDMFDAVAYEVLENLFPEDMQLTVRFVKNLSMRGWKAAQYQIRETGEQIFVMEGFSEVFAAVCQAAETVDFDSLLDFKKLISFIGVEIPRDEETVDPKTRNVGVTESAVTVTEEYSFTDRYNFDTMHFLVLTNGSEETVNVVTSSVAYDADGNVLGASDTTVRGVGPGCTAIAAEYFGVDDEPAYYDTQVSVTPNEAYICANQMLSVRTDETKNGAVFTVENTGEAAADFTEGYALFFEEGKLVEYDWLIFVDEDGKLKPGKKVTKQADAYEKFDEVRLYINSYDDTRIN